ncbi:MAG: flippase [Clostridia bacterium]|nr:flippase [Clostridia bacterium]
MIVWRIMKYRRIFDNAKWIVICKVVQSLLQLLIGMFSARYLGPENYGLLKYAASVVAFALPVMKLGMDATLVHELVEKPHMESKIIGTSLTMNFASSLACMGAVSAFASVMNAGETETILVCALYSVSLVFAALEMIQYWFQYKLMSKYSSITMLCVYTAVMVYKVFLLASGKSVYWFALSISLEYGLVAAVLLVIYIKKGGRLSFSLATAKEMLGRSKHYITASMMLVILQNTDHIMLTEMSGKFQNGLYSAAITCTSVTQFVFIAIIDSFRPVILENKKQNSDEYGLNVSRLYCVTQYLAIAQSVVFTVLAELIIIVLYGAEYSAAVPVLRILIWYYSFSVMGVVRNVWILAEQKQKYLWVINLLGAMTNIVLNAFFIPRWDACGAAAASLITQFIMNFVIGFIFGPIRQNNRLLLRGINPMFAFRESKHVFSMLKNKETPEEADNIY